MNPTSDQQRIRVIVRGAVQGVGFRPFVFRLAQELGLTGYVNNFPAGVGIEAEAPKAALEQFLHRLQTERPPRSIIQSLESWWLDPVGYVQFEIRPSTHAGAKSAVVMADIATCEDCVRELFDPQDRRYLYPFINCTNCGPRFSIIEALPYDRANTSMKRFTMCPECRSEYEAPQSRRFHAQPNACPLCGPHLELWDCTGKPVISPDVLCNQHAILRAAVEAIQRGRIVALKGIGGFHLIVDAANSQAVQELRIRKHREEKPFAVMFPSIETAQQACEISETEERLLRAPEAPIVLLRQRSASGAPPVVSASVAPDNPCLGVLLPYTPLHHLLLSRLRAPVVATSANLSDEPICIDEYEAVDRLKGIADLFLVHNRPIVRHVDDSILRVMAGRELMLRRARGFAPLPIELRSSAQAVQETQAPAKLRTAGDEKAIRASDPQCVIGVGGQLKSAVALGIGTQVFISQHIGDLETPQAIQAFERVVADLQGLYESPATTLVADAHPDYFSTRFATQTGLPVRTVQHHVAHVLACMADNQLAPPILGVSWDGTGYGLDGTVWGGEFFHITDAKVERIAHLRTFCLPGGEQAIREPRRSGLGLLFELFGPSALNRADSPTVQAFSSDELRVVGRMLTQQINSPRTSSVGRLFDAVASLLGLRQATHFEGQSAMQLEFLAVETAEMAGYDFSLDTRSNPWIIDWAPAVEMFLVDLAAGVAPALIAAKFHLGLAESITEVARLAGLPRVALSGGCFQNRFLTEASVKSLRRAGFRPYWHQRVPPNDGGICLGQVVAALPRRGYA